MSANKRRTLAIKIETPGGDNPLTMRLVGRGPFFRGIAVANLALVGQGGSPPYAFSIVSGGDSNGGLNGLTLNTDGTFSGVPDDAGRFVFVATVSDSASQTYTHSFSLTFKAQLILVAGTPTPGEIGLAYSYQFVVRDLSGVTVTSGYTLLSGNLPAGLSLNTNGTLSDTPTQPYGVSYFVVRVIAGSDFLDIPCSIQIYDELVISITEEFLGIDPSLLELPPIKRGVRYVAHAVRTGGAPIGNWRLLSGQTSNGPDAWPSGIKIDNNGIINGVTSATRTPSISPLLVPVVGISFTDQLGAEVEAFWHLRVVNAAGSVRRVPFDASGDIPLVSTDGSITFEETLSGELDMKSVGTTTGGGISTVNGVGPDSSGNLQITGVEIDSNGDLYVDAGVSVVRRGPGCMFDGGGVALSGTVTRNIEIPYAFAGTGWTIVANVSGDASIVVRHATYAAFPTMTTLLTATLSAAQKSQATGLTFALAAGDILQFEGSGFTTVSVVAITLNGTGN